MSQHIPSTMPPPSVPSTLPPPDDDVVTTEQPAVTLEALRRQIELSRMEDRYGRD